MNESESPPPPPPPPNAPVPPFSKEEEERKRDRMMARDPAKRWLLIQQAITWAEANMKPEYRRNRPRQPHQK